MVKKCFLLTVVLSLLPTAVPTALHAGFIIDDFDSAAQIRNPSLPPVRDSWRVPNYGPFGAERHLSSWHVFRDIYGRRLPVVLEADASITRAGVYHMAVSNMPDPPHLTDLGNFSLSYQFPALDPTVGIDFTEGGENTGFRFDFAYSRGPTPIRNIRIITDHWLYTWLPELPETEEPFSVFVPFSDFRDRSGLPPGNRFTNISSFIEFQFQTAGNDLRPFYHDRGWQVGLDRISVVPEPGSLSVLMLWAFGALRVRRR